MACFPMFVELCGKTGLIVGGGTVALRKIEKLLPYGPALIVTAPSFTAEICAVPGLTLHRRDFTPEDLEGVDFVIAATDDREVNREVSRRCQALRIPVNVVDDAELCSFLFPALVQRGKLSVGISTGGSSPTAAICLKEQIGALLPEDTGEILDYLHRVREEVKAAFADGRQRKELLRTLFAAAMAEGRPLTRQETETLFRRQEERGRRP